MTMEHSQMGLVPLSLWPSKDTGRSCSVVGPHETLNIPAPTSRTSSPKLWKINFYFYIPLSLQKSTTFVVAAQTDEASLQVVLASQPLSLPADITKKRGNRNKLSPPHCVCDP